ncbi:N-acetylneuraminate synthase family protein [Marinobacter sp. DS40M6]|uniref:N-acetylneuraminate synthase family protein n=1 Tax=Marinobacter sp. DS40M6 TaxID=1597776 RepID=UPI0023597DB1|nr:N-acetylneuraminate synthase family protein [Marinobacter sp. DS40M6]MDC8456143.1 N-acetylneuraminate synthase family protein [Marinobacter sp. DS40M6]
MVDNPSFKIAGRDVGVDFPPLVVAEIGINHEGSLDTAKEMVDAAKRAGIEVVKHQTHVVEDEMSAEAKKVIPGNSDVSIYEIMERCSLSEAEEVALKNYVESKGMIFISTPFSREAANRLNRMGVEAFKIGSGECNNYPLLMHVAKMGKPVILSTGMNDLLSIRKAVEIFKSHNIPLAILHTTNLYPTPPHLVRLGAFKQMKNEFPDLVVGLSDHTITNHACFAAVALGASVLERHFTDRMDREGPDIVNSMDEHAARDLIVGSQMIWEMRGGIKEAAEEERVTIDFAFATVVATKPIEKGGVLTEDNIWVKRPGKGEIPAEKYYDLIGKRVKRAVSSDEHLEWKDIER